MVEATITDPKKRFAFGKNWARFLENLDNNSIKEAEESLKKMLNCENLKGKTFLDVGSGSGLFSLAAHYLGAKVISFDYDQDSVNCTKFIKENYGNNNNEWTIKQGSVLDKDFLKQFKQVDILYSWGVLHHTGHMLQAFENVSSLVKEGGFLFISIYNDQGIKSKAWKKIKQTYVHLPFLRSFLVLFCGLWLWKENILWGFLRYGNPFKYISEYSRNRGMSAWYDLLDWLGGYPFEVAKPEVVFNFFKSRKFQLATIKTCGGFIGCNQFVFLKK